MQTGICKFGDSCQYDHPPRLPAGAASKVSSQGLLPTPERPPASEAASSISSPGTAGGQPPPVTPDTASFLGKKVQTWTVDDVSAFVCGLTQDFGDKASMYAEAMRREDIRGDLLVKLTDAELRESLGLSLGHRKLFLARIAGL